MTQATALIIDDEKDIRELIEMAFMGIGITCVLSPTVNDALKQLKTQHQQLDFCITDMRLPDGDGLDLVSHIQKNYPELPVCVITAHGNMELAVKALKLGAFDFVNKPFDLKQLRAMAKAAIKIRQDTHPVPDSNTPGIDNTATNKAIAKKVAIIGDSLVMQRLSQIISKLARSQAPVFIHGESGTGKELVARSIHEQSARQDGPFIPVNCGAIPENLVESEFFGYRKGAFTGANKDHTGLFAAANGGTLFLDEVADLPLSMQVKLLRAIQERAIRPIGADKEVPIDIRILSATHKDLNQLVQSRDFREDLYYRLNVISLGIPPLRKRQGDIELLVNFILDNLAKNQKISHFVLEDSALSKLNAYSFPGNVRELENILERAATFCENQTITVDDIHFGTTTIESHHEDFTGMQFDLSDGLIDIDDMDAKTSEESIDVNPMFDASTTQRQQPTVSTHAPAANDVGGDLDSYMENIERQAIQAAMTDSHHNITKAAEKLGISFRSLRYKLKKYGMR